MMRSSPSVSSFAERVAARISDADFIDDFCNWQAIDTYRRFIVDSPPRRRRNG